MPSRQFVLSPRQNKCGKLAFPFRHRSHVSAIDTFCMSVSLSPPPPPHVSLSPPPPPTSSLSHSLYLSLRHTVASCSDTFCVSVFPPPPSLYICLSSGHTDASCSDTFCLSVPLSHSVGHTNASCSDIFHLSPPAPPLTPRISLSLSHCIYIAYFLYIHRLFL